MHVIEASDLTKRFGNLVAVDHVSFSVCARAGFDATKVATDFQFLIGFALIFSLVGILIARTGLRKG